MDNPTKIFKKFESLTVLIVGDVMIDRYITGKVDRISPEAPVPIVRMDANENRLGGAANVALNIKAMGATPILVSLIGEDENGKIFKERMSENGLALEGVLNTEHRKTTVKTRIIASGQHLLRVDNEDQHNLLEIEENLVFEKIKTLLQKHKVDAILFQDYNKGILTKSLIHKTLQLAENHEIITTVDPKMKNFLAYKNVTLFKPNLKEIQASLSPMLTVDLTALKNAATQLRKELNQANTMITLSENGIFYENKTEHEIQPTFPRSIADVSGAGDTVISVATLALAANLNLKTASQLSNLAGGQVCEKVGVVPVDKKQLLEEWKAVNNHC